MSMQDRLNKVHEYVNIVTYMLTCVHRAEKQLTTMSSAYSDSMDKDTKPESILIELHDIKFEARLGYQGIITYKEKTYPTESTSVGRQFSNDVYVTLDELLHTVCHLEEFIKYAVDYLIKNEISCLKECVDAIKEATVADLL
jgi:hypothetical protein